MNSAARIAARPSGQRERRLLLLISYALTASAAAVTAVAVAASGAPNHPALVGLARGLIVATPIAVGLYAWQRPSTERFGLLLIAAGAGCFVTTLAESRQEIVDRICAYKPLGFREVVLDFRRDTLDEMLSDLEIVTQEIRPAVDRA